MGIYQGKVWCVMEQEPVFFVEINWTPGYLSISCFDFKHLKKICVCGVLQHHGGKQNCLLLKSSEPHIQFFILLSPSTWVWMQFSSCESKTCLSNITVCPYCLWSSSTCGWHHHYSLSLCCWASGETGSNANWTDIMWNMFLNQFFPLKTQ